MKIDVRIPAFLNSEITSVKKSLCLIVSHPAFEVKTSGESGTRVTCSGFTFKTKSINLLFGFPSILNSVLTTSFN